MLHYLRLEETLGEWGKKGEKRTRGTLAPAVTACSQFAPEESSNKISGGRARFTGSF